jgi:putative thioredoxin
MDTNAQEVNAANFDALVIERSKTIPVIVDFWAPWCAPCRALKPVLEKLAGEYEGKIALATLNTDDNQQLATRYGIRGIPAVKVFQDGEIVDEFTGALPESQVRVFIESLIPSPAEELRRAARAHIVAGDAAGALATLEQARVLDPRNDLVAIDRAEALVHLGQNEAARQALEELRGAAAEDERAKRLLAQLEFAAGVADVDDARSLQRKVAADPNDSESRVKLADWHVSRREFEPALERLLEVVQRDRGFGDDLARKKILAVFALLENGGELVERYRRLLARALN